MDDWAKIRQLFSTGQHSKREIGRLVGVSRGTVDRVLEAHEALPAVHRVFSLVKRWVMGTLQGSASAEHLQAYFDEWVFRFNRRHSRSRGLQFYRLMQQAVDGDAVSYKELRKADRSRPPPAAPTTARSLPSSLDRGHVGLPWRQTDPR